jgi:hypothetical protein
MSEIDPNVGPTPADLFAAAKVRAKGVVDLGAAELRLAAMSVLRMLLLVVLAGASLVIAWGLLVACILFLCAYLQIPWLYATLVLLAGHAAVAYYFWTATIRLSNNLTLPQLREALVGEANDGGGGGLHARTAVAR